MKTAPFIAAVLFVLPLLAPTSAAEFSLATEKPTVKVGQTFSVDVVLSGNEDTLGADVILQFDPQKLTAREVQSGTLYPTYNPSPENRIDQGSGTIVLSGSGGLDQPVPASGTFATLSFEAVQPGKTTLAIMFAPGATNQSGIIDPAGNELVRVTPTPLALDIKDQFFLDKLLRWLTRLLRFPP